MKEGMGLNYITLDLEWNQPAPDCKTVHQLTTEIIQIGAVKMDDSFLIIDQFKADVRPRFYPQIKHEVQQLTGISEEQLKQGMSFPQAVQQLQQWCGQEFALITWSHEDVPVLRKNMEVYQMEFGWLPDAYDLQVVYSLQQLGKYQQTALVKAMMQMGMEPELTAHDALHDALYTAQLCQKLDMEKGIGEYNIYQKEAAKGRAIAVKTQDGYTTPEQAHEDDALREFVCPECGMEMKSQPWEKQKGVKRTAKTHCPTHGDFEIRLRIQPRRNQTFRARAALYQIEEKE